MALDLRPYRRDRDLDAVTRIWQEVGWIEPDTESAEAALASFLDASQVEVGMVDDDAECAVARVDGTIRYQETDLPLTAVTAVTTSWIGRKRGFATTMTARALQNGAEGGAAVAALGMFDQGFYDRVGFGSGTYHHEVRFDPATLQLDHIPYRQPVRLSPDDEEEIHALVTRRRRGHGAVIAGPAPVLGAELRWLSKPFLLGYRNDDGRLTHLIGGESKGEHGPYKVTLLAYEKAEQLLELLRLLRELGDQIDSVQIPEPPEIQLQDLIAAPIAQIRRTRSSVHAAGTDTYAWMQFRLLDLEPCIAARSWPGNPVRCNLELTDPVTAVLERNGPIGERWGGVAGRYLLDIGERSSIEPGHDPERPTLTASIGAFSRCWFGVRPATGLALTDELAGPPELLAVLDEALRLPPPKPGWDF